MDAALVDLHNPESERAVLGSLLLDSAQFSVVRDTISSPDDFFLPAHQGIYRSMIALANQTPPVPLDAQTVLGHLASVGELRSVGGSPYLITLLEAVPAAIHAEHYARIVATLALRRRVVAHSQRSLSWAHDQNLELDALVSKIEDDFRTSAKMSGRESLVSVGDALGEHLETLADLADNGLGQRAVRTGFYDFDNLLGGLRRGNLDIFAARTSVGKSAFAISVAHRTALAYGTKTAMFSMEMPRQQVLGRLLSAESAVDSKKLRTGRITEEEWERVYKAAGVLQDIPIFIDDTSAITPSMIASRCRRMQQERGLDLIIVDYIQWMRPDNETSGENRTREVDEISKALKALARDMDIPVFALCQVGRGVDARASHVPLLSDLRESAGLEMNADSVTFGVREELYDPQTEKKGIMDLYVAKNRDGEVGQMQLLYLSHITKFVDFEPGSGAP